MNIYIGNLPYSTDEDAIRGMFEPFGDVRSVKLIEDRDTGRLKGFGFVEMEDDGGRQAVEELNESELGGRNVVVNEARPRTERKSGFNNRRRY